MGSSIGAEEMMLGDIQGSTAGDEEEIHILIRLKPLNESYRWRHWKRGMCALYFVFQEERCINIHLPNKNNIP